MGIPGRYRRGCRVIDMASAHGLVVSGEPAAEVAAVHGTAIELSTIIGFAKPA